MWFKSKFPAALHQPAPKSVIQASLGEPWLSKTDDFLTKRMGGRGHLQYQKFILQILSYIKPTQAALFHQKPAISILKVKPSLR